MRCPRPTRALEATELPVAPSIRVGPRLGAPRRVALESIKRFGYDGTREIERLLRQEFRLQQGRSHLLITVIASALPNVLHIPALEHPLDHEAPLRIHVHAVVIHIPEDPAVEYRCGGRHAAKVGNARPHLKREGGCEAAPETAQTAIFAAPFQQRGHLPRWRNR